MDPFSRSALRPMTSILALALVGVATALAGGPDEAAFLTENHAAMSTMMAAMEIEASGDVDADFVAMMAPHHQGAIDMAQAELRYGRNERLRRLAQEIVVTQQQEIAAMRLALDPPSPAARLPAAQTDVSPRAPMQREH
jgi:uncharacterized protein (DUF305 family)